MARPFGKKKKQKKKLALVVPRVPYASLQKNSRTARRARTSLRKLAADIADSSKEARPKSYTGAILRGDRGRKQY